MWRTIREAAVGGGSSSGLGAPAGDGFGRQTVGSSSGFGYARCLRQECVSVSRDAPGCRIHLCLPGRAEGLRWHPLSEIEKPGSGTEPIHQEHVMCSRFRGSCPSDVKSAVHPEPGFPISLSVFTAALCAPREIQKNPAARSVPGYRPRFQALSSGHRKPEEER